MGLEVIEKTRSELAQENVPGSATLAGKPQGKKKPPLMTAH